MKKELTVNKNVFGSDIENTLATDKKNEERESGKKESVGEK